MSEVVSWLDTIGRVFEGIPDLATPDQVESALSEILDDPGLTLYWWDWELERYVDVRGVTAEPAAGAGGAVTWVGYETRKIGALAHDARLLDVPEFTATLIPLMRIAMERDRLHRDLVSKLDQLRASRLRILETADGERRRLERNLHDGAQQRLTAALLGLRTLEGRLSEDPELVAMARGALEELEGAIDELRELARGLHPPLLAQRGLEAALRAGAARAAIPVEVDLRLPRRLPEALEAAAYYVCSEACTNAVKHARASGLWLTVADEENALTVVVRDDGIGGACIECQEEASGLGGLVDRVEALGGTLAIVSPDGGGTTLTAVFPLEPEPGL
ncbi:sensor histidine kinase [Gaiella sp.]|uniref:sensor histidine kinase n=1 Tax=Gaiella sp. TaxID=2663207 RepID=UPI002C958D09|nr:histidine kinase [Gaiella sp.]HWO82092.1 histidine kinase [Gaiella sp.]